MAQLRQDYQAFVQQAAEIVVVGPEGADQFQEYWKKHDLPFIGLPDPQHRVLRLYGQEVNLFKFGRMPAQVVIDRGGRARFVHYGKSMADIPENQELLELLRNLNFEMEVSSPSVSRAT
jgi:peroxiredoxin Q/BCP